MLDLYIEFRCQHTPYIYSFCIDVSVHLLFWIQYPLASNHSESSFGPVSWTLNEQISQPVISGSSLSALSHSSFSLIRPLPTVNMKKRTNKAPSAPAGPAASAGILRFYTDDHPGMCVDILTCIYIIQTCLSDRVYISLPA